MSRDIASLYAPAAAGGPPLFFPTPERPIFFNFDQGNPDPATYPLDLLERLSHEVLEEAGGDALSYFDPDTGYEELVYGFRGLRTALADRLNERDGREFDADNVILTSGAVQALSLAARAFAGPGDAVFVEAVTFPYASSFLAGTGADVVAVPVDADGLDVHALADAIDAAAARGLRPKLVYTIATFQLPTGMSMPPSRRERLLQLADRHDLVVIEDNVYYDLRYDGEPPPTLLSMDETGLVMQSDSFSKTVAPGLRLGWMVGHPDVIGGLAAVREDLGVSQFLARVMARYLEGGHHGPQVATLRDVYRAKRDAAVTALHEHCSEYLTFRVPEGSFFLWLELGDGVDWDRAAEAVQREGVFCRPGERFTDDGSGRQFLRLAFSLPSVDEITQGIAALGRALRDSST
ncbi:MAG: PLP-dependent aminotransferase family protein [Acidimicrobiales bacterium]|nr:PLP-dependent aminotransferase family protein [Acidimicrobiales bacterium]